MSLSSCKFFAFCSLLLVVLHFLLGGVCHRRCGLIGSASSIDLCSPQGLERAVLLTAHLQVTLHHGPHPLQEPHRRALALPARRCAVTVIDVSLPALQTAQDTALLAESVLLLLHSVFTTSTRCPGPTLPARIRRPCHHAPRRGGRGLPRADAVCRNRAPGRLGCCGSPVASGVSPVRSGTRNPRAGFASGVENSFTVSVAFGAGTSLRPATVSPVASALCPLSLGSGGLLACVGLQFSSNLEKRRPFSSDVFRVPSHAPGSSPRSSLLLSV